MAHFRKAARAAVDLKARFRRDGARFTLERSARMSDLSVGGAFLHDSALEVGARLVIWVTAPSAWEPLELLAEVRWTRDEGVGVAFRSVNKTQATALRALVDAVGYARETR